MDIELEVLILTFFDEIVEDQMKEAIRRSNKRFAEVISGELAEARREIKKEFLRKMIDIRKRFMTRLGEAKAENAVYLAVPMKKEPEDPTELL